MRMLSLLMNPNPTKGRAGGGRVGHSSGAKTSGMEWFGGGGLGAAAGSPEIGWRPGPPVDKLLDEHLGEGDVGDRGAHAHHHQPPEHTPDRGGKGVTGCVEKPSPVPLAPPGPPWAVRRWGQLGSLPPVSRARSIRRHGRESGGRGAGGAARSRRSLQKVVVIVGQDRVEDTAEEDRAAPAGEVKGLLLCRWQLPVGDGLQHT